MARKNTRLSTTNTTPPAPPTPSTTRGVKKHKKPASPPPQPVTDTTNSVNAHEDEISTSVRALLSPQDPADALESCRALYLHHGRAAVESHALHRDVAQAMEKAFEKIYDAPGITNKDVRSQLNFLRGKKCEWYPALSGGKLYAWFGKDAVESRRFTDALKGLARMRGDARQMLGLEDALALLGEVREQRKAGVRGERIAQAAEWTASDCFEAGKLATERFGVKWVKTETRRQSPKRKKAKGHKADHGQAEQADCTDNGGRSAPDGQDGPEMPHKDTNSPHSNGQDSPDLSGDSDGWKSPRQGQPKAPDGDRIDAAKQKTAGNGCPLAADNQDGPAMPDQRGPSTPEKPQQPEQPEQPDDQGGTAKKTSTRAGGSPAAGDEDASSTSNEDDMSIEQGRQGNQMYEGDRLDDVPSLFFNDHDDHDDPDLNSPAPPRTHSHIPSRSPSQRSSAQPQRHDSGRESQFGSRSRTSPLSSPVATPPRLSINIKTITEFGSPASTTANFQLDTPKFLSPEPLQLKKAGPQLMARTGKKRRRTPAGTSHLRSRGTGHVSQWKRTRDDLKSDNGLRASIAHDCASARTFLALFATVQAPLPQHPQGPIVMNAEMDDGSTVTTALLAPEIPPAAAHDGNGDDQARWLLALLTSDSAQDPPTFTITVYSARERPSADLGARVRSIPPAALDQNQANAIANLSDEQMRIHHLPAVHDLRDDDASDFIKCLATNVLLVSNHESPASSSLPEHLFLWAWMGALATITSDNRSRISEVTSMVELPEVEMAGSTPFPDHQDGSNCVEDLSAAVTSCKADVAALNGQIGLVKKYEVHLRLLRDCIDRAASEGASSPNSDAASSSELDVHIAALETLQRDLPAQVFVKAGYDATLKGLREQKRVNSSPKDERALKELQTWIHLSMGEADGEVCRGEKVRMEVVKCLEELVGELQSWLKNVTG